MTHAELRMGVTFQCCPTEGQSGQALVIASPSGQDALCTWGACGLAEGPWQLLPAAFQLGLPVLSLCCLMPHFLSLSLSHPQLLYS